jgi:hypothetical protein
VHKDLVPNYMLISSLQEAAKSAFKVTSTDSSNDAKIAETDEEDKLEEDDENTSDVSLSGT